MKLRYEGSGYECVLRDGFSEADTVFENHCHPFYEMIMVVCGKISISIENRRYTVSAGECVFIKPAEYHSLRSLDEAQYRRFTILFGEELIPIGIREELISRMRSAPVRVHPDMPSLFARLEWAVRQESREAYEPLATAILTELMYLLCEAESFSPEDESDKHLQEMVTYISEHITERLGLEEVAASALISRSSVSHIFKSRMNVSFKQYVLQKKIAYAAGLIQGGMTANEAANVIGYGNYAGFYKMYKKFLAEAPSNRKKPREV
jgi:AraC-like DNA-binding protein